MELVKNEGMEPWSVGKYAKRTATIHIGSKDQLRYSTINPMVLPQPQPFMGTELLMTLYPLQALTAGPVQSLTFHTVTAAQINNAAAVSATGTLVTINGVPSVLLNQFVDATMGGIVPGTGDYFEVVDAGRSAIAVGTTFALNRTVAAAANRYPAATVRTANIPNANPNFWFDGNYVPDIGRSNAQCAAGQTSAGAVNGTIGNIAQVNNETINAVVYSNSRFTFTGGVPVAVGDMMCISVTTAANVTKNSYLSAGQPPGPTYPGGRFTPASNTNNQQWLYRRVLEITANGGVNYTARTLEIPAAMVNSVNGGAPHLSHFFRHAQFVVRSPEFPFANESHTNFNVPIPNIIGFPEHKRCLIQVQSAYFYAQDEMDLATDTGAGMTTTPPLIGVEIKGLAPQNTFSTFVGRLPDNLAAGAHRQAGVGTSAMIGYGMLTPIGFKRSVNAGNDTSVNQRLAYGFNSHNSITEEGVLVSSPFGKSINVRFVNMTTGETLKSDTPGFDDEALSAVAIENNPTHLVLKLLFLDDDELPMR